ncbi:hypothetical protein MUS_3202 [Bacillus velezensis YAU B9601-Y2]|uniref:Uncharacterized protein n=1 Tax=Bacillus amyloliquefaciens (strain Y2) TaxID=1155777 RepID=I2C8W3_BACAY|nr:hypothetical protein MUS_3202 [Bacillus velezensis YAU B9601-Y2]AHZ16941.1 hypothetical protein V529_29150 [Bacillus velezensis SQR9]EIF14249.1 hypothetical protein MY7_2585 [Bacillus sp. 5B6]RUS08012.1 hypothetical protein EFW58_00760 [Bacillus velezensis]
MSNGVILHSTFFAAKQTETDGFHTVKSVVQPYLSAFSKEIRILLKFF